MPLHFIHISEKNGRVGVWHLTESAAFFMDKRAFLGREREEIQDMTAHRRLDWLASRHLLGEILGRTAYLIKDEFGKPFLEQFEQIGEESELIVKLFEQEISLSHTKNWIAAIVSPHSVGIDIQRLTPKLEGMAWRVMNDDKLKQLDPNNRLEHLHVYWGAKEALYKAWGKRDLHFKDNIIIKPFDYAQFAENAHTIQRVTEGVVRKENFEQLYDIYFSKINDNILVYCLETEPV